MVTRTSTDTAKRKRITERLEQDRSRLDLYLEQEARMLAGGVQSYGIGSRSLARYNMDLDRIRSSIKELQEEIDSLEDALDGKARRAVAAVPRDW